MNRITEIQYVKERSVHKKSSNICIQVYSSMSSTPCAILTVLTVSNVMEGPSWS